MDEIMEYLKGERATLYIVAGSVAILAWILLDYSTELLARAGYLRAVDSLPETDTETVIESEPKNE